MFWLHKKNAETPVNSSEYEKLNKKLIEVNTAIEELKIKFKILETDHDNLRGNFNRKLRGIRAEQEEETKDINTPVILPFNGVFK